MERLRNFCVIQAQLGWRHVIHMFDFPNTTIPTDNMIDQYNTQVSDLR